LNPKAIPTPRTGYERLAERITERIDDSGECWLWQGHTSADGYAFFSVNGRNTAVHRVSYEAFVAPMPDGLEIDHLCRVRSCVNPSHLEAVTHRVNMQRRVYTPELRAQCRNGHLYDEQNTLTNSGRRRCRACHVEAMRRYRQKARASR
jgi:hypothetical protein